MSDTLIIKAPEKIRNSWSLAMRTFANNRASCEVESMHDFSNTETGCLMSKAGSQDLSDLGVEVGKDSVFDVTQRLQDPEAMQYTLSFKDSNNATFETCLDSTDVDNSFLSTPKFLVHAIYFAQSSAAWPTVSNKGLQSILHAFLDLDTCGEQDRLLFIPKKNFTTSLPLRTVDVPQTFKATCNAYELRSNSQKVLQEFTHMQCKYQELHTNAIDIGHLVMETLCMKDKLSDYTATVQLTPSNNVEEAILQSEECETEKIEKSKNSEAYSVHVIHANAHYKLQLQCLPNEGSRKLHLPAYAALHKLQSSPNPRLNYKALMCNSTLQKLHIGYAITALILRSNSTPIVFLMVPCSQAKSPISEPHKLDIDENSLASNDNCGENCCGSECDCDNCCGRNCCDEDCSCDDCCCSRLKPSTDFNQLSLTESKHMPVVDEYISVDNTVAMRSAQVQIEDAFYTGYTQVIKQDPIMRQALFRRSNRDE
jgi:hypothetical protein